MASTDKPANHAQADRQRAEPFWFLFEIADDPVWDHPLWLEHRNTVPCVRVDVRGIFDAQGRFTWAPAAGPADTAEGFIKLLWRLIDGFGPHMGPRGIPFRWYGKPAALGSTYDEQFHKAYPNVHPLLNHPGDRLRSGRRGPWAERGIEANRAWTSECMDMLAQTLKFRGLPDPLAFILSSENGLGDDYWGHNGDPDTGWVNDALRDQRADDPAHTIDGRTTFRAYFDAARTLEGGPVPEYRHHAQPAMPPGRHPINAESSERYRGAIRRLWDYSRFKGFAEPMQRAFARGRAGAATPLVGEYQSGSDSKPHPVLVRPGERFHQMDGFFLSDLQCPDWYGGLPWGLVDEGLFTPNHAGWNTVTNWYRALGIDDRGERSDPVRRRQVAALELAKRNLRAHALSAPRARLAPYCESLRAMTLDDMLDYLRTCRSLGGWGVNIFMPKPDRANHDEWLRVVEAMNA